MNKNLQIAIDFADKLKASKGILQIVLFGSVAKGEDTTSSDIDIAIVHELKDTEHLKSLVNKILHEKIQVVYVHKSKLAKEMELVSALTGEGLLLYGKPLKVVFDKKQLKPFVVIIYDTTSLAKKQRMLLNRALHGSISRNKYKGKVYTTETKGLLAQPGLVKLTKACIVAEPKKAVILRDVLKQFKAKVTEELIWK